MDSAIPSIHLFANGYVQAVHKNKCIELLQRPDLLFISRLNHPVCDAVDDHHANVKCIYIDVKYIMLFYILYNAIIITR